VYLTQVRLDADRQDVLFSLNCAAMDIPEGLSVEWEDTLCKRALEQGQAFTSDASLCWGDSDAARLLGIRTYVSTAIRYADGRLFGTLCGASRDVRELQGEARNALSLFGALIQQYVQRERLIADLQQANALLKAQSYRDPLTDLPNRRLLFMELRRLLAVAQAEGRLVYVAFIDLDGFKQINDRYGHEIGDAFLIEVGRRLAGVISARDVLGRLGGDEFVVVALCDAQDPNVTPERCWLYEKLEKCLRGQYELGSVSLDYAGASVGVVKADLDIAAPEDLLRRADAAMYAEKNARRAAACC
jgi:diguanylate cyclase